MTLSAHRYFWRHASEAWRQGDVKPLMRRNLRGAVLSGNKVIAFSFVTPLTERQEGS